MRATPLVSLTPLAPPPPVQSLTTPEFFRLFGLRGIAFNTKIHRQRIHPSR